MKNFDEWNEVKKEIDEKRKSLFFSEREIVFVNMGKNIGFEEDGKGKEFLRPVLILKKFNAHQFIGFAMTSQTPNKKNEKFYYKLSDKSFVILSQIRTYSPKRISHSIGKISESKLAEIYEKFNKLVTPSK